MCINVILIVVYCKISTYNFKGVVSYVKDMFISEHTLHQQNIKRCKRSVKCMYQYWWWCHDIYISGSEFRAASQFLSNSNHCLITWWHSRFIPRTTLSAFPSEQAAWFMLLPFAGHRCHLQLIFWMAVLLIKLSTMNSTTHSSPLLQVLLMLSCLTSEYIMHMSFMTQVLHLILRIRVWEDHHETKQK